MFEFLKNFLYRLKHGVKAAYSVEEQFAAIDKSLGRENDSYTKRFERMYPAGFFKMFAGRDEVIAHWCPRCKTLSDPAGRQVKHCGKTEQRPDGWRLAFLPRSTPKHSF
jgi:hypothetical protein